MNKRHLVHLSLDMLLHPSWRTWKAQSLRQRWYALADRTGYKCLDPIQLQPNADDPIPFKIVN